jgi:alpha-glucosidase
VDGPDHLAIRRRYVEARYRLMPYLYALAEENARTGDPIMRPVFYDYPDALGASCDSAMSFTLGRDLLIAGPPKPESPAPFDICLPKGRWYDYWTGLPVSGAKMTVKPALETLPVFVRAGAILPRQPVVQSTSETPRGPLSLDIYPGDDCRGALYLDDGISVAGPSLRQKISCESTPSGLRIHFDKRLGTYRPWWTSIALTVHDWEGAAAIARGPSARLDPAARTLSLAIPDEPGPADIVIARR